MNDPTKSMTAKELIDLIVACYTEAVEYRVKALPDEQRHADLDDGDLAAVVPAPVTAFSVACTESADRAEQQALRWVAELRELAEDTHPNAFVDFGVSLAISLGHRAYCGFAGERSLWRAIIAKHCRIVLTL